MDEALNQAEKGSDDSEAGENARQVLEILRTDPRVGHRLEIEEGGRWLSRPNSRHAALCADQRVLFVKGRFELLPSLGEARSDEDPVEFRFDSLRVLGLDRLDLLYKINEAKTKRQTPEDVLQQEMCEETGLQQT